MYIKISSQRLRNKNLIATEIIFSLYTYRINIHFTWALENSGISDTTEADKVANQGALLLYLPIFTIIPMLQCQTTRC